MGGEVMIIVVGGVKLKVKFTILSSHAFNVIALEYDSRNIVICADSTALVIYNYYGVVFSYTPANCKRSVDLIIRPHEFVHNDVTPFSLSLRDPNMGWSNPILYTFSKKLYRDKCLDRFVRLVSQYNHWFNHQPCRLVIE